MRSSRGAACVAPPLRISRAKHIGHAKIKSVITTFHKTLADTRVRFLGNLNLGTDFTVDDARHYYDAIVYAAAHRTTGGWAFPAKDPAAVDRLFAERGIRVARWQDWLAIDKQERTLGARVAANA